MRIYIPATRIVLKPQFQKTFEIWKWAGKKTRVGIRTDLEAAKERDGIWSVYPMAAHIWTKF